MRKMIYIIYIIILFYQRIDQKAENETTYFQMYKSNHKGNLESSLETIQDSGHPGGSTWGGGAARRKDGGNSGFNF